MTEDPNKCLHSASSDPHWTLRFVTKALRDHMDTLLVNIDDTLRHRDEVDLLLPRNKIPLYRDDPIFDPEISAQDGLPWRCDLYHADGDWSLFATVWGKGRIEAITKANSIKQALSIAT